MPIRTIEIICLPCAKCEYVKARIQDAIKTLEIVYKIKIQYELRHTTHLKDICRYNLTPAQTPAVLINGHLEFAGRVEPGIIKRKIEGAHKASHM